MSQTVLLLPDPDAPERVAVSPLQDGRWLITDIPCFSAQVGFLDVVLAQMDPNYGLTLVSVLEPSPWSTFALVLRNRDTTLTARMLLLIEQTGSHIMSRDTSAGGAYVSVAVRPEMLDKVTNIIEDGHKQGLWLAGPVLERRVSAAA